MSSYKRTIKIKVIKIAKNMFGRFATNSECKNADPSSGSSFSLPGVFGCWPSSGVSEAVSLLILTIEALMGSLESAIDDGTLLAFMPQFLELAISLSVALISRSCCSFLS